MSSRCSKNTIQIKGLALSFILLPSSSMFLIQLTLFLTIQAGKTLSARRWHAAFTEDGHLDMERVLRRIQRGVSLYISISLSWFVVFVVHFGTFSPGDSSINQRRGLGVFVRWLRSRQHVWWKNQAEEPQKVLSVFCKILTSLVDVLMS